MRLLALFLFVALLMTAAFATEEAPDAAVDYPLAPIKDFVLKDPEGHSVSFAKMPGRVWIIDFFATWAAPCRTKIPELIALQDQYGSQGLQIIGVASDATGSDWTPEAVANVRKVALALKINYPVLIMEDSIAKRFGGEIVVPTTFIIGPDRRIRRKLKGRQTNKALEDVFLPLLQSK